MKKLGWDTGNPSTHPSGQVYEQREFYHHDHLLTKALGKKALGKKIPENIVVIPWEVGPRYWIIEAKADHRDLNKALHEAQNCAGKVNAREPDAARFATGIAGTPDKSFFVRTAYWDDAKWEPVSINGNEITGFLTKEQCKNILNKNSPRIHHYDVDLGRFLDKANGINATLHRNGVAARDRARMVAGLLLTLAQDSTMRIDTNPSTLVRDVNARIHALLTRHSKQDFYEEVNMRPPNTQENHRKYWLAIVETMQLLREMNIRSAINSGTDALGQFYETFLQYANDASEMGIVLTPRHITKFAVDILAIQPDDLIFDPACGTGGFLVAALDWIRKKYSATHPHYKTFQNDCLYGVEQADAVFGLALVNMIFRGDGKSHIYNGNCFDNRFALVNKQVKRLKSDTETKHLPSAPFTRVMMNPPFAIDDEPEWMFVDYALNQMRCGGLLFAILPNGPITGVKKGDVLWRHELLKRHTVRAVVKMPEDLFMPNVSKGTYALVLEAWRKHLTDNRVFFGILHDDLHASRKSKLLGEKRAKDNLEQMTDDIKRFLTDGRVWIEPIPQEVCISTVNMDSVCDIAPESYLEGDLPDVGTSQPVEGLVVELARRAARRKRRPPPPPKATREFEIQDLFVVQRGQCPPMNSLPSGTIPVVTTSESSNGVAGYYAVDKKLIERDRITISANGSGGAPFWHPYQFAATSDVLVCKWHPIWDVSPALCLYVCNAISQNAWRFDYYRKCSRDRLLADVRIRLPMKGNLVDYDYIEREMNRMPVFTQILEMINSQT